MLYALYKNLIMWLHDDFLHVDAHGQYSIQDQISSDFQVSCLI